MRVILTANRLTAAIVTPTRWRMPADWAAKENISLLYNPKDALSFFSGPWNTGTNPDLDFASENLNSFEVDGRTLEKILRSQHQSSVIATFKKFANMKSQVSRTSVEIFERSIGNYSASSQTI